MSRLLFFLLMLTLLLAACSVADRKGTIAELRNVEIKIEDEQIEGGLEKAIRSYQHFLDAAAGSEMVPEAIRRLADLKVEKEYGLIAEQNESDQQHSEWTSPEPASNPVPETFVKKTQASLVGSEAEAKSEQQELASLLPEEPLLAEDAAVQPVDDLERAGAVEAVELYRKLLSEYPHYAHNDQVLYQLSRAYEELGRIEEAMKVMNRLVKEYPDSRYLDEVQFRRAEYFFTHRRFMDAEDAYESIVNIGVGSSYYLLSLYKLGWTFYKQELYEEALHRFIALLDYKVSVGYDFEQTEDDIEGKRVRDTFRVVSLSFSYLGGADSVVDYFSRRGHRVFEDSIYAHLAEYYFTKRRYSDAVSTYEAFITRNLFHKKSPLFHMRVININIAGGFPSLVIESKKTFATNYAMDADYWQYFNPEERPEVLKDLKTNLADLATHYHALYQNPKYADKKSVNYAEALHWYRGYLRSFPNDLESPSVNYQLADLLLESRSFGEAAVEYEKTAYEYPLHIQSSKAGYAAVFSLRKQLDRVKKKNRDSVKREIVRSSLKFSATFPKHEKAALVLGAAADDLYALEEFEAALTAAQDLIENFPVADMKTRLSAWLVAAHSSYELELYSQAETAYVEVLSLLPAEDAERPGLIDNLAASIYKQGEQARTDEDYSAAAEHFLRVVDMAPTSKIRPTAEYDAAAALMHLKAWSRAATVLLGFRNNFPGHELQHDVTKKIAFVYRENGQYAQAADEFERIEAESDNAEVRRESLLIAAELHEKSNNIERTLVVYRRYVDYFPRPVEDNLEARSKIAEILKQQNHDAYLRELKQIVMIDANAGDERTERTLSLAASAALVLAEVSYESFEVVKLVKPFEVNLRKKQVRMKKALQNFGKLLDYELGETTAAATYYMAEIYGHFSRSLMTSERPDGLSPLELEEYEL
ncbi:MAG TPA: tetratricopeptide repeat protein, partial [Geopsychrobacteraceae bacterium]|nr:tetratricopeptide repeat protein [Geopsychrobacteraceae bacterium]